MAIPYDWHPSNTPVEFENTDLPDIIELKNILQIYETKKGPFTVIKDLNFLVEDKPNQGQFVVILGTSGCGKSTVLRYIAALQQPTSGDILIKGKAQFPDFYIPMVFQKYSSLENRSVLDNVALGLEIAGESKKVRHEKAMAIIKKVGLLGHEKKYAKYPNLSGGQLQRVAIARCLLTNPDILLMDEPFGALDSHTRFMMQELLAKLWLELQLTCIFVTHDIPEAVFLADEIVLMRSNPGQIVERIEVPFGLERPKELKRSKKFTDMVFYIEDRLTKLGELGLASANAKATDNITSPPLPEPESKPPEAGELPSQPQKRTKW